jgi:hypothetical protein
MRRRALTTNRQGRAVRLGRLSVSLAIAATGAVLPNAWAPAAATGTSSSFKPVRQTSRMFVFRPKSIPAQAVRKASLKFTLRGGSKAETAGRRVSAARVRRALRGSKPVRVRRPSTARRARLVIHWAGCAFGSFSNQPWNVPCASWRPYGAESPFNRRLPAAPRLDPNSANVVGRTLGFGNQAYFWGGTAGSEADWESPTYYSRPTDPLFEIHCWRYDCPELEGKRIRIPQRAEPAHSVDGHMAVVDQANHIEYDFSRAGDLPKGGGPLAIAAGGATVIGTPGADGLGGDSTAAGFGLLAGAIRPSELERGVINHALLVSIACSGGTVWPAAPTQTGALCSDTTNAPKLGQHFWLDMSDAQIDAISAPAWRKAIWRALAHYGAYVGDTAGVNGNLGIAAESTQSWLSFGYADPWVALGERYGLETWRDSAGVLRYLFDARPGVDWASRLRVVDPCVSRGTC